MNLSYEETRNFMMSIESIAESLAVIARSKMEIIYEYRYAEDGLQGENLVTWMNEFARDGWQFLTLDKDGDAILRREVRE